MHFSVMILKVCLKILLVVIFYAAEILIILYWMMNHLQKLYEALKLVYELITSYAESYPYHH